MITPTIRPMWIPQQQRHRVVITIPETSPAWVAEIVASSPYFMPVIEEDD